MPVINGNIGESGWFLIPARGTIRKSALEGRRPCSNVRINTEGPRRSGVMPSDFLNYIFPSGLFLFLKIALGQG